MSLITDAQFLTACNAVLPPYGPLVPVGTLPNMDANEGSRIEVTSALSVNFFVSYDELNDWNDLERILEQVHSVRGVNHPAYDIAKTIEALNEYILAMSGPGYTDDEYQLMINVLRTIRPMVAQPPNFPADDIVKPTCNFTAIDAGAQAVDITAVTVVGDVYLYLWDWGDSTTSTGVSPANHTYGGGAGTYNVTLTVVGPGGVGRRTKAVVIA